MKKLTILILTVLMSFSVFSQEIFQKDSLNYVFLKKDSLTYTWYEVDIEKGAVRQIHSQNVYVEGVEIPMEKLAFREDFFILSNYRDISSTEGLRIFPLKVRHYQNRFDFRWDECKEKYDVRTTIEREKIRYFVFGHLFLLALWVTIIIGFYKVIFDFDLDLNEILSDVLVWIFLFAVFSAVFFTAPFGGMSIFAGIILSVMVSVFSFVVVGAILRALSILIRFLFRKKEKEKEKKVE